ncbi:MAG: bacillithiol biosynthesis cysteine-adding enzyme BshC [Candidatus Hydrogenedentes bacterium]|nr:bacillithiol biosynthesis cysteine-adding enzyme BshC [Candidatus Hydrogenedentota bacterium]
MASLIEDYLAGHPELMKFYAGVPRGVTGADLSPAPWNASLVDGIRRYQAHIGSNGTLRGDEGVFITGQQPGIFTGPLYTIYKAITAIKLAQAASETSGHAFLPIYWVGGDDHDFDEIREAHLLSRNHVDVSLALLPAPGQVASSIYRLPVRDELHDLAELAAAQAPGSEFSGEILGFLHESLQASANLSEWHARLMARLFRDTPLVIFTPELPEARELAIPVFEREIRHPLASTRLLNEGGARLESAGYGAQVVKGDDTCNFFLERAGVRCRVRHGEGLFILPDTGERFSEAELLELLHREPGVFTANVGLRCIVQQTLFPVRSYVAGPGEVAYWGQLKEVFEFFERPMPIVYPRMRAALTSLKSNKLLEKYKLRIGDLYAPAESLEERALRSAAQDPSLAVLTGRADAIIRELEGMERDFDALGKAGRQALPLGRQFQAQVRQGLDYLERSLLRADEGRTATVRSQLARLGTELAPGRKPQERHYTIFSWLFQYGWELVPRLTATLDHNDFSLQEVEL